MDSVLFLKTFIFNATPLQRDNGWVWGVACPCNTPTLCCPLRGRAALSGFLLLHGAGQQHSTGGHTFDILQNLGPESELHELSL